MFKTIFLFVLFLISLTVSASSVDKWLDKMSSAQSRQNYQGTLVIRQGDKLQVIKVKQGAEAGKSWQTLVSQTGKDQIILRKNGQVTTIFPDKKLITVSTSNGGRTIKGPLHPTLPENRDHLKQYYLLKLGREERIANKTTQVLQITPRDKHRYGYTFWLDKQSGLLLKCDLVNDRGRVLEQLMYSNIELLPVAPDNQVDESKLASFKKIILSGKTDLNSKIWLAKKIPAGFVLTRSMKTEQKNPTYHMVFSDGMASVSVFIATAKENQQAPVGQSSMGPVNAYSSLVDGTYITAIGEVPVSTVRMIAQSVHPR